MVHAGNVRFDGLTRGNAQALLKAAEKAGVSTKEVRTDSTGFVVPAEVADALTKKDAKELGEPETAETETPAEDKPKRARRTAKATAEADDKG